MVNKKTRQTAVLLILTILCTFLLNGGQTVSAASTTNTFSTAVNRITHFTTAQPGLSFKDNGDGTGTITVSVEKGSDLSSFEFGVVYDSSKVTITNKAIIDCNMLVKSMEENGSSETIVAYAPDFESYLSTAPTAILNTDTSNNNPSNLLGDVNGDYIVDLKDAQMALKIALGIIPGDSSALSAADLNNDFQVTITTT